MRVWKILILIALFAFLPAVAGAVTVDELIAKNILARGGLDKLRAIQSMRITGTMKFGGGSSPRAITRWIKRPGLYRSELSMQGLTAVTAFDGNEGWQIQPFGGRVDPVKMSADDAKGLKRDSDIDGPMVDYKAKGSVVEYLGTEDVDGTDAHKIKVTFADGDVRYVYLDPDYFLEIRYIDQTRNRGVQFEQETDVGNYEVINGVYLPFSVEYGERGGEKYGKFAVEKIEVNVEMDSTLFQFPAGKSGR